MHVVVVGGGIIGLTVARELALGGRRVTLLEKEDGWARHQSGRNSGVVHSGLYYRPGSFKARMCVAGARSIVAYARAHGVPVSVCGKLVVATRNEELPGLAELARRGEVKPEAPREALERYQLHDVRAAGAGNTLGEA